MLSLNYFVVGTPQGAGATHCELPSEERVQSLLESARQHYPSSCGRVGVGELEAYYARITEEDFDREWTIVSTLRYKALDHHMLTHEDPG